MFNPHLKGDKNYSPSIKLIENKSSPTYKQKIIRKHKFYAKSNENQINMEG